MAAKTEEELFSRLMENTRGASPYKEFYITNFKDIPGNDYCVMQHSNKVCLVYLAETHSIIHQNEDIDSVEFCCIASNPEDYKVTGKTKNKWIACTINGILCLLKQFYQSRDLGFEFSHVKNHLLENTSILGRYTEISFDKCAKKIKIGSSLCKIHITDKVYNIPSCVRGNLIEINENLTVNPNLVKTKHNSDGYLVIIQPRFKDLTCMVETVMDAGKYKQSKEARTTHREGEDN